MLPERAASFPRVNTEERITRTPGRCRERRQSQSGSNSTGHEIRGIPEEFSAACLHRTSSTTHLITWCFFLSFGQCRKIRDDAGHARIEEIIPVRAIVEFACSLMTSPMIPAVYPARHPADKKRGCYPGVINCEMSPGCLPRCVSRQDLHLAYGRSASGRP